MHLNHQNIIYIHIYMLLFNTYTWFIVGNLWCEVLTAVCVFSVFIYIL